MEAMESTAAAGVQRETGWDDAEVLDRVAPENTTPAAGPVPAGSDDPETPDPESHEPATHGPGDQPGDQPGAPPEPADDAEWHQRAAAAEQQTLAMADRLTAVEAAAEDLRRMLGEGERARQIDRELLVAGVADLDAARTLVEAQITDGATVLEAVSRVRERRPLLFASRGRSVRATTVPAGDRANGGTMGDVAEAARETGDRRILLRYLRMRRGLNS